MPTVTKEKEQELLRMPLCFPIEFSEGKLPTKIHVLPMGEWDHSLYGKIKISERDIKEFIKNFNAGIRKGVPITEGHEVGDEKPAISWFKKLYKAKDGLWANVDWTEKGKELLTQKAYKYFSPEFYRVYEDPETHEIYTNVLVGGALTNKPYFKGLKAIVFTDLLINKSKFMELKDLLQKDAGTLTDEEKKFLRSKMSELKVEDIRKFAEDLEGGDKDGGDDDKEGDGDGDKGDKDGEGDDKDGNDKDGDDGDKDDDKDDDKKGDDKKGVNGSEIKISAAEYKALKGKADLGATAFAELKKAKVEKEVDKMTFNEQNREGKILPKNKDAVVSFMLTLSAKQAKEFSEIMGNLPKAGIFGEIGDMGVEGGDSIDKELTAKVATMRKAEDGLGYSDAVRRIFAEDPGFAERYNEAHEPA